MRISDKFITRLTVGVCTLAMIISCFGIKSVEITPPESTDHSPSPQVMSVSAQSDSQNNDNSESENQTDSADTKDSSEEESADTDFAPSDSSRLPENSSDGGEKSNNISVIKTVYSTDGDTTGDSSSDDDSKGSSSDEKNTSSDSSDESNADKNDSTEDDKIYTSDDGNNADIPGKNTVENGETDLQLFTTSIIDGERVENPEYSFTITHLNDELTVLQTQITVNGSGVIWSGTVNLSADNGGENVIRVAVSYADSDGKIVSGYLEYTVYLVSADSGQEDEKADEPVLVTDLYSHTRSDPKLDFTAYLSGNADNVKLKIYLGSEKLAGEENEYSCTLQLGVNTIRIKASFDFDGERRVIEQEYRIKLVAETTADTAPYLEYHNVPETVKGTVYTLDLAPRDFSGAKLYYNNLYVSLNGENVKYSWDGVYTSYLLLLTAGENTLEIRVTDSVGRYTDYYFVITCLAAQDGEVIGYASLEADANSLGLGVILPSVTIEIRQGESAAQTIVRTLEENGFEVGGTGDLSGGYYLSRLYMENMSAAAAIPDELKAFIQSDSEVRFTSQSDPNSLGERDFTNASGWMISVNGHFISYGLSDLHLKDTDVLRLRFTLAYGKDIGANAEGGNYEVVY